MSLPPGFNPNNPEQVSQLQIDLSNSCYPLIPGIGNSYGYRPSLAAGIVFLVLFGLSMIAHAVQSIWKRTWWSMVFTVGCITEILGWAGRVWSYKCPYNMNAFLMQITTLIIAPTFFTAGIYVILGNYIKLLGRNCSILTPNLYLWIFCTCDVASLIIQAIGGGMAATEADKVDGNTKPGTDIMVAGIVFQLFSISVFVACAADFIRRSLRRGLLQTLGKGRGPTFLFAAMIFSILCVYVRCIYRTIELAQGWSGFLITHERFFIAMDGAMMAPAVGVFNFFHPGWLLPSSLPESSDFGHEDSGLGSSDGIHGDGYDDDKRPQSEF